MKKLTESYLLALVLSLLCFPANAREMGEPDLSGDDFSKRFTGSYGILSSREPPISEIEQGILKKLAPMMRIDRKLAQELLESMTVGQAESSATFNYLLGNLYFDNQEYLLAEEQYKIAIDSFPDFQRAWTNLGVLKLRGDDTKSALLAFLKAVELGDSSAHTYGMLGYCHFAEGNYMSAEVAYNRAMLLQPNSLEWLEGKAQVYFAAERYIEAIRMQDELIARQPYNINYWLAQTNSYLALEEFKKTARNLEIVRSLGGADFRSLFLLGSLYTKLGMHPAAAEVYLAAAELAGDNDVEFMVQSSVLLFRNGQFASARNLFDRVNPSLLVEDPSLEFDYKMLAGDFAQHDGESDKAIKIFEQAEVLDPLDGTVLIKLARLYNDAGNRDKAYFLLDRAENDPEAEYNALLTRVKFLIDEERFEESQVYVSRALRLQANESIQNLYRQVEQAVRDRS